jgi:LysM repeat protein
VIYVTKGTSFLSVAQEHKLSLSRLFDFNDMGQHEVAETDQLIYLQRKRKAGNNDTHKVGFGETLFSIAQSEGIRLESLLSLNFLQDGQLPEVGETLYLRHKAPQMPRLASATAKADLPHFVQTAATQAAVVQPVAESATYTEHIVQPKETLYAISKKYGVSIDDVMKWNELEDGNLKSGQALRIKK